MHGMHAATFKVVNSAQGSSCKLKFVHGQYLLVSPGVSSTQIRAAFEQIIFDDLNATVFGKNLPKYGIGHKSCSIKQAEKFQSKCCFSRIASFAFRSKMCVCKYLKLVKYYNFSSRHCQHGGSR